MFDLQLLLVVGGFAACTILQEAARKYHVTMLMAARAAVATAKRTIFKAFEDVYEDPFDSCDEQDDYAACNDTQALGNSPYSLVLIRPSATDIMLHIPSRSSPVALSPPKQQKALQLRRNVAAGALAAYVAQDSPLYCPTAAAVNMESTAVAPCVSSSISPQYTPAGVAHSINPGCAKTKLRSRAWLGAVGFISAAAVVYQLQQLQAGSDAGHESTALCHTQDAADTQISKHRLESQDLTPSRPAAASRVTNRNSSTSSRWQQQRKTQQQDQLLGALLRQQWMLDKDLTQLLRRQSVGSATSSLQRAQSRRGTAVAGVHLAAVEGLLQQLEDYDVQLAEALVEMSYPECQ